MFDDLSDENLEEELCSQAANLSAGECHLLSVMAELERREVWARQGARSCAYWLSWRIGTAIGAAREQLRVARALERLAHTRAAFSSGELSYSKVRAITRVADEQTDAQLVELARHATAAQLERIVREYRRADPNEQEKANAAHLGRYLRQRSDAEGMIVIEARLDPDEAAVVLAAIERVRAELAEQRAAEDSATEQRAAEDSAAEQRAAEDSAAEQRAATEDLAGPGDVSAETPLGATDIDEPTDSLVDAATGAETKAADALVAMCAAVLANGICEVDDPHVSVLVHVDEQVLTDERSPGCAHIEGLGSIAAHAAARLACDGAVSRLLSRDDGAVEPLGTTRVIPTAMRRALFARDRGCRFPGCTARRFLHAHHVVYASRGGPTKLSNLVAICSWHHRLVHDGGWRLVLSRGGQLRVFSPQDTEVRNVAPARSGSATGLGESNAARGIRLDPEALTADGERFDLDITIDGLLRLAGRGGDAGR